MFSDPRWGDDPRDDVRDRDDDYREPGRGSSSTNRDDHDGDDSGARDDSRDPSLRDRDSRDQDCRDDPRDALMWQVDLPRGHEREVVWDRDHEYTLRGSETRTLSTVGAFRVVSARDLRDHRNSPAHERSADLRHLREQGLIQTVRVPGHRDPVVVLTKHGRDLLERHRDRHDGAHQTFYAGLKRAREVEHDAQVFAAYLREAERLQEQGARIDRVVLDYELKREYQKWLHERDRDQDDYDGHPDRTEDEIQDWAAQHDLPYFDDQVHFPDVRIEYEDIDGRHDHEDIEVVTIHYRGAHRAATAGSGFTCHGAASARVGGGGRAPDPHLAEEFLR